MRGQSLNPRCVPLFVAVMISLVATACNHPLRIINGIDYFSPPIPAANQPLTLGVTSNSDTHPQNGRYVTAIVDALQRTGSFDRILYPYDAAAHGDQVDVPFNIAVNPSYEGRGSNFFVNWPGFLIFAPAIWGYGYQADLQTVVDIKRNGDTESKRIEVTPHYDFRQAEIDRTWTEVGWLEVSLIPFIGGFAFMSYDPDVTNEFIREVSPNYGAFVAGKLVAAL
jgi:hypothetical protein